MPPVTAAVRSGNLNLVKLLVNAGANLNPVHFEKNEGLFIHSFEIENKLVSPMKMACYDSLPEMVFYLLEKGAIPKPEHLVTACNGGQECIDSPDGPTYQDKKTRIKIVEMLLTSGIDPNGIKTSSRSPIGEVVSYYDVDTVQLLLKAGAKPHLNKAFMAFREAWDNVEQQDKAKKIIRLFLDAGADLRDLHESWFSTFKKMDIATPEELDLLKKLEHTIAVAS